MPEFSRRVNVFVFKDDPLTFDQFVDAAPEAWAPEVPGGKARAEMYRDYLAAFQPYRWHAKAMNGEIIARGESYFNESDCHENIELNYGDDTTVYRMPEYGEQRGEAWLRYGKTDRDAQAAQS